MLLSCPYEQRFSLLIIVCTRISNRILHVKNVYQKPLIGSLLFHEGMFYMYTHLWSNMCSVIICIGLLQGPLKLIYVYNGIREK